MIDIDTNEIIYQGSKNDLNISGYTLIDIQSGFAFKSETFTKIGEYLAGASNFALLWWCL